MTSRVSHTTIDCARAYDLSSWWKEVLGYTDLPGDPNEPGDAECMIQSSDGVHRLLFVEVPEPKQDKNRIHLDLRPVDQTRDQEVERLTALGAALVRDQRGIYGPHTGWVVLTDPEGNEFDVLQSDAERSERPPESAVVTAGREGPS